MTAEMTRQRPDAAPHSSVAGDSTARIWRPVIGWVLLALTTAASPGNARAEVAGSVEAGLQQLANEIVQKTVAVDRNSIAVLPFPSADGTCSVLSNYLVDELSLSLFSVPNSHLKIVERSQLEAVIAELQIGEGGLLDTKTTQQLGKLSGVQALVLGTITVIGDAVRINARLIAADTGQTVSAAAVTIPRTQTIAELLSKPVKTGLTCGGARPATARSTGGGPSFQPAPAPSSKPAGPASSTGGDVPQVTLEQITFAVQHVSRQESEVRITLGITNTTDSPVEVQIIRYSISLIDNKGWTGSSIDISGIAECNAGMVRTCQEYFSDGSGTTLQPGSQRMSVWAVRNNRGERSQGDSSSLSFSFLARGLNGKGGAKLISGTIGNIPLSE